MPNKQQVNITKPSFPRLVVDVAMNLTSMHESTAYMLYYQIIVLQANNDDINAVLG